MNVLKIGHRGSPFNAPENTMASFKCAKKVGVDMIGFGVRETKDGRVMVIKNNSLDLTTNGSGLVSDTIYEDLKDLDVGSVGYRMPTLEEVLDFVDGCMACNIVLSGRRIVDSVARIINDYHDWKPDDLLISSFDVEELRAFKKLVPDVRIGLLVDDSKNWLPNSRALKAYSVNLNKDLVDEVFLNKAHANNLKVFVWTVDDPEEIDRMKELGVDGIFSNCPHRL